MDMQRIMNNENYIRTGGIGENFFIPMMENQDYRHKIENEISLRLGGKKNFEMSLEERTAVEQRKVEKCKNSWRKMVDSYLDLANEPIENLDVKFKPYDFKEWEAQLGKEPYIVTESQTAVGKLGVAQELLNEQNEKTRYSEQKGKNTWMQYGFDKEAVFNAMMSNVGKAKEEQIAIPQPRLRELSLRDKIKKRFTGKCQVDEDNKKIQAQYNRFVAQVQQLSEGWDFNCCPCAPTTFDRLDEFIKTAEKGFEQKRLLSLAYNHLGTAGGHFLDDAEHVLLEHFADGHCGLEVILAADARAVHNAVFHQLLNVALSGNHIGQIKLGKLNLAGRVFKLAFPYDPVI